MRRTGAAAIAFATVAVDPFISRPINCALMPIVVKMQLPSAVATRSVGEKLSPLP
jgi:hypothetical protein